MVCSLQVPGEQGARIERHQRNSASNFCQEVDQHIVKLKQKKQPHVQVLSPEQSCELIYHTPEAKQAEEEERRKRLLEARYHVM